MDLRLHCAREHISPDGLIISVTAMEQGEVIASATMTSMLDVLEHRGWIKRVPNSDDRRSVLIQITPDGRKTTDQVIPGIHNVELRTMAALSAKERSQLISLLAKVLDRANEITAEPSEPLTGKRNRPARLS